MNKQTELMWAKMMRAEAIITEALNNEDERREYDNPNHKPMNDHIYWLFTLEHRYMN